MAETIPRHRQEGGIQHVDTLDKDDWRPRSGWCVLTFSSDHLELRKNLMFIPGIFHLMFSGCKASVNWDGRKRDHRGTGSSAMPSFQDRFLTTALEFTAWDIKGIMKTLENTKNILLSQLRSRVCLSVDKLLGLEQDERCDERSFV